jgi:[ribosomal protein S18]-alanine N-acetyltransferase
MSAINLDYKLVVMLPADLAEVMRNERQCYSHPWTDGIFLDCLKSGYECWLFVTHNVNIGHGVLSVAAAESHLLNVCIHPDHQGNGFGRMLVAHMMQRARGRNAERIFLEVRRSNVAARTLYDELGFNEIGVRRNYYPATVGREDALVFAKEFV